MSNGIIDNNVVTVGVGDYKIVRAPKVLKTLLGSCIGIALYDQTVRVGGLLHIMLPKREGDSSHKVAKYADTGIPAMVNHMISAAGVRKATLIAKLFGGACMFTGGSPMFDIGKRNEDETRRILQGMGIKIVACKTGGTKGYNIVFDTNTGKITCRIFGESTEVY